MTNTIQYPFIISYSIVISDVSLTNSNKDDLKYRYVLTNMNHQLKYLLRQHFCFLKTVDTSSQGQYICKDNNTVPHLRHVRQFPL